MGSVSLAGEDREWALARLSSGAAPGKARPSSCKDQGVSAQTLKTRTHIISSWLDGARVLSHFRRVQHFATPWTVARQAPLSMGFSRREDWSGLPCPPPGGLPDPGVEPISLMSPALAGGSFTTRATREAQLGGVPKHLERVSDLSKTVRGCLGPRHTAPFRVEHGRAWTE